MRLRVPSALFLVPVAALILAAPRADAVVAGYVEEFTGAGNTAGWGGGSQSTNPGTGGFLGSGDGYLQVKNLAPGPLGSNSSGSAAFAGDYIAAGITAIQLSLNDVGPAQSFNLHLCIGNQTNFWQYNTSMVPPNGGWTTFTVPLTGPSGWTRIIGSGTFNDALQLADRILVRHDGPPYIQTPDNAAGDFGIDHIVLISPATPARSTSWGRIKGLYK